MSNQFVNAERLQQLQDWLRQPNGALWATDDVQLLGQLKQFCEHQGMRTLSLRVDSEFKRWE